MSDARAARRRSSSRPARPAETPDESDNEPLIPRETLREYARDALRTAYEGLDGMVLDLDDI